MLKFLCRRDLVYWEGYNWTQKHFAWLRSLVSDGVLENEDRSTFLEYLSLLEYKLGHREELDR